MREHQNIQNYLKSWLAKPEPDVAVLKGNWGAGKTYLWNKFIQENKKTVPEPYSRYAYVSLFGIDSVAALKNSIAINTISISDIGNDFDIENLGSSLRSLKTSSEGNLVRWLRAKVPRLFGFFGHSAFWTLPYLSNVSTLSAAIAYLTVRNIVICFDDLERSAEDLDKRQFLGLVSELKESRNAKIILICNSKELDQSAGWSDAFSRYSEKVIDKQFLYAPTTPYLLNLLKDRAKCSEEEISLFENIERLKVKNLRIISRIVSNWKEIEQKFSERHLSIRRQVLHTLPIACAAKFDGEGVYPPLKFLNQWGSVAFHIRRYQSDGSESESPEEKTWIAILNDYGYRETDEVDKHIFMYLEQGYFNDSSLDKSLRDREDLLVKGEGEDKWRKAWKLFHDGFGDNEGEFIAALQNALEEAGEYLTPMNLSGAVQMLKELGEQAKARDFINRYLEINSSKLEDFDLNDYSFSSEVRDLDVREALKSLSSSGDAERSIDEIIADSTDYSFFQANDMHALAKKESDEFEKFIRENEEGMEFARGVLSMRRIVNPDEDMTRLISTVEQALKQLAMHSRIDRLRVQRLGIDVEDNSSSSK